MNKIVLVLMLLVAPSVFADEPSTYAMVLGQYVSGNIDNCTGNCDADPSKESLTISAGVGIRYRFAAIEIPISPYGIGANIIFSRPLGDAHAIGVGLGYMPIGYDMNWSPGSTGSVDGHVSIAFLDYSVKLAQELRAVIRIGAQRGDVSGTGSLSMGGVVVERYSANISQTGWFGQIGFQYSPK